MALDRAGYGRPFPKKPRRLRGHGARLEHRERLKGLVGKLPRAVALRLPTTSNNALSGRRDGRDVWGEVRCNLTLRDGVLGLLAIAGGLWVKQSKPGERHVNLTAGEAAYLLRAKRRESKRSARDGTSRGCTSRLARLSSLKLRADGGGEGHEIPTHRSSECFESSMASGSPSSSTPSASKQESAPRPAPATRSGSSSPTGSSPNSATPSAGRC